MSHHDHNMAGLAFVQKVYLSLQAWFYGVSPAPATLAAGMGGAGGGDGDDDGTTMIHTLKNVGRSHSQNFLPGFLTL